MTESAAGGPAPSAMWLGRSTPPETAEGIQRVLQREAALVSHQLG